ncbi:MAG: hypothetical protein EG828_01400 [Deltaproteobacteria bacterium]|nr:hypothetical protein [Deltaproteobacteria bacterium]
MIIRGGSGSALTAVPTDSVNIAATLSGTSEIIKKIGTILNTTVVTVTDSGSGTKVQNNVKF